MRTKLSFVILLLFLTAIFSSEAAQTNSEAHLIEMLSSRDFKKMSQAMKLLPVLYPKSSNAVDFLKGILRSNDVLVVTQFVEVSISKNGNQSVSPIVKFAPHVLIARMTARALGNYHANLSNQELQQIYKLLRSRDVNTTMDGLKALRGLNAPQAETEILPLLEDDNVHVRRDACRTLAVLGSKRDIPYIQPLLKDFRVDVRADAQSAIEKLENKQ
jgi:HEAT repeat protein